jgi:TPR repeat protein
MNYLKNGAELGFPPTQYSLGLSYLQGIGIEKDEQKAKFWINNAKEQEFPYWK